MNRRDGSPGAPLPVRPRPRQGETADSYLRRLAAANHLRFSYLRRYLATPRGSYGPIDAGWLAVLAGRKPHAILRAFRELGPAALRQAGTGRRVFWRGCARVMRDPDGGVLSAEGQVRR